MRRLILLAIGVSLLLWTASVRTGGIPPADITKMSGVESCLLVGAPQPADDADEQWRAPQGSTLPAGESSWTSPQFHAVLASAPTARLFDPAHVSPSPDPAESSAPPYLRHIPLLI